ncbi:MAG: SAM-dependent methyltransferase [Nitrospira sp.]|nr:SAM-dependent methyltransferase [bacterium]MBL7049122.1 SAM-dependent methyltransferase [Nitrospira sp.]
MNELGRIIADRIRAGGAMTFEQFMKLALYHPEEGYYSSPDIRIGRDGDFFTSPHLHPSFGAVIAKQLLEMWQITGRPDQFSVVEMGAGAGYLCKDIMDYLLTTTKQNSSFIRALDYCIVEPFSHFKKLQKKTIGDYSADINWFSSLNELSGITGCILSNELLDAFSVHVIEMQDELKEIYVDYNGSEFTEQPDKLSNLLIHDYINLFSIAFPAGYRTEVNLQMKDWLHDVAKSLDSGFVMSIDYGYSNAEYYTPERSSGTLLCYYNHEYNNNPYQHIGSQDMTAHVNFSALKIWGEQLGLQTVGYASQGTFLVSAGIDEVISELYSNPDEYTKNISQIKGLIMPQGMGESHRVMIQCKGIEVPALRGFALKNQASLL